MCKDCGERKPGDEKRPMCEACKARDRLFQKLRAEQPKCPWCASMPYGWNDFRLLYDCGAYVRRNESSGPLSHPGHACSVIASLRQQVKDREDDIKYIEREARDELREVQHERDRFEEEANRW